MQKPTIITAITPNYLPYLAVLLRSLSESANQTTTVDVVVVHKGVSTADQALIRTQLDERHGLAWFEHSADEIARLNAPLEFIRCNSYFYSLLAPYILPDSDRALYLDADMLVMRDLTPLWQEPLHGHAVGAVTDWLSTFEIAVTRHKELGVPGDAPYFNAGLLLMDLNQFRADDIAATVWTHAEHHPEGLAAPSPQGFGQWDQYSYNLALVGRWHELSTHWNHFSERPVPNEAPAIVHFLGNGKPGRPTCQPHFTERFLETVSRTPWPTWRMMR